MNEKKIHIVSLVPYKIFPALMGGQKGIALFYKYLGKKNTLTVFTTKNNEPSEPYEVINTISNSKSRYVNPFLFFQLKKIALEKRATHLLFEHPYFAWLIFLCKYFCSQKIILHTHNIESERFKSIGKRWWIVLFYYEKWAMKNADLIWFKTNEDKQFAESKYQIAPEKCVVIPYGIEENQLPPLFEMEAAATEIRSKYKISKNHTLILFNGTLNYKPNLDALLFILEKINPFLLQENFEYTILICGKGLPDSLQDLKEYQSKNIIYCGFVEDINLYFKACNIFLNPLQDGGGIKTKLVEALGFGKMAVSSANGAIGIDASITNGRLHIVNDQDWQAYCNEILLCSVQMAKDENEAFYQVFSWSNIAQKALDSIC